MTKWPNFVGCRRSDPIWDATVTVFARIGTLIGMTLETFTLDMFTGRIGEAFSVEIEGTPQFDVRLEAVREIAAAGWRPEEAADHRKPFALQFLGPAGFVLPQAIYKFVHGEFGTFEMFIVPIGRTAAGVAYEAVFS